MIFRLCRFGSAAALLLAFSAGCHTMHTDLSTSCSENSCSDNGGTTDGCTTGSDCVSSGHSCGDGSGCGLFGGGNGSGCGLFGGDGPRRWSDDWYCSRANAPAGGRQKFHKCQTWPPYPRPTGPKQEYWHRFHTAHYWPYPYNTQDLAYLRKVSATQVANGWTTEMTLFAHHFAIDSNELNQAGLLHLKWIVQVAPPHRRHVWVQASDDKAVNATRMTSVQNAAAELAIDGNVPPISLRVAPRDGRPTDEVNRIRMLENGSMNAPRIPYAIGGNSAGAGAGAAGSGGGGGISP